MTWRPLPVGPEDEPPRPVAESLDRITQALGGPRASVLTTLFSRWDDIVGAAVAAHTRPVSLHRAVLTIAVDHPAWAAQLSYLEGDIRRRIEEVVGAGAVARVRLTVRPK